MNRSQKYSPLASISGNIIPKSPPTSNKAAINAASFMDRRFDIYVDEPSENVAYDLPDAHSSDSSYDLRILEEMRAQRETQYARRRQLAKTIENTPGKTPRLTPGISQRLIANQPRNFGRLPQIESEEDNDTFTNEPRQGPILTRFLRHLPIEKDPHVTITHPVNRKPEFHEEFMQTAEDSPLSRKSSARGTPATTQLRKQVSTSRSDSWDLSGDLKDQLGFTSTPAPYRNRNIRQFDGSDGDDETEDILKPLNVRSKEKSPDLKSAPNPLDSNLEALRTQLESLPESSTQTPWKTQPKAVDSMDVLKMLSRSVSKSPSPKSESPDGSKQPAPYTARSKSKLNDSESKFASAIDSLPGVSASSPNSPNKTSAPQTKSSIKDSSSTKSLKRTDSVKFQSSNLTKNSLTVPETPLVTGAFVSTPEATKLKSNSQDSNVKLEAKPNEPKPSPKFSSTAQLPKSAISSIVQRAKSNVETPSDIGDTTIHSLEDIMEHTTDDNVTADSFTDNLHPLQGTTSIDSTSALRELLEHKLASELPFSQGLLPSIEEQRLIREIVEQRLSRTMKSQVKQLRSTSKKQDEKPAEAKNSERNFWPSLSILTPRRKGRMEEELQLQRMSNHVNTMSSRTRELKADMSRLEKKLVQSPVDRPATRTNVALRRVTSLFWEKGQLTWFGLVFLILALWLVAEMTLCLIKCEPLYTSFIKNNYGPFIDGTRPPFVLVQMICYPISWIFAPASASWITGSMRWMGKFVWHLWTDGESTEPQKWTSRTTVAYSEATSLGDWSMDGDEFM